MCSKVISITQNINDSQSDYDYLFHLCQQYRDTRNSDITFDFTGCRFLRQNAVVVLGGLIRILQQQGNTVMFRLNTIDSAVRMNLEQNGFLHHLGLGGSPWNGNSIPYREDTYLDANGFTDYLSEKWIGKGCIDVSNTLRDHIVSHVIEAYINVFDHADSPVGVITCGQHYPKMRILKIAMLDMGVGIPHNVREYLNKPDMSAQDTLRWAFEPMKTTKDQNNFARGNGLKLLKAFMEENHGTLEIFSETAYTRIDAQDNRFQHRQQSFQGTIVQVTLTCDPTKYILPEEADSESDDWFF